MAYSKQTWQTGDTITAAKLNHMEDGIAATSNYDLVITMTDDSLTADGLSLEELLQKGIRNLNIAFDDKGTFEKIAGFAAEIDPDPLVANTLTLVLPTGVGDYSSIILANGYAEFDADAYTYTYSDGHYVFTPSSP